MSLFSNAFRKNVYNIKGPQNIIGSTTGQAVLQAINKYRSYLSTNTGVTDSLISALTMDQSLIKDDFIEKAVVEFKGSTADYVEIPNDIASEILQGLREATHQGDNQQDVSGVTVTDGSGRSYNFVDVESEYRAVDGYWILFANSRYPDSLSEGVLLLNLADNKYYLNNFIRTTNFVKDGGRRVKPTTISGLVDSIGYIIKGRQLQGTDILTKLSDLFDGYHGVDVSNIQDALLQGFSLEWHWAIEDTIYDTLSTCWDTANAIFPLPQGKGQITSLWNVIQDNIESSALNSVILQACDAVIGGFNSATAVNALITECTASKYKSVKQFSHGVAGAFHRGGIYGVGCYIVSYIKNLTDSVVNDDQTLAFTDNSRLAPQIYLAGVIEGIVTVASTLMSVIAAVFSKIAGAALALIGSAISMIFKAISYDYSSTNAAINNDEGVVLPISPFGVFQTEISVSSIAGLNADLAALIDQGQNLNYVEIPGGYLMMGPGSFDNDGSPLTYRMEFHPSIIDSRDCFTQLFDWLRAQNYLTFTRSVNTVTMSLSRINFRTHDNRIVRDKVIKLWNAQNNIALINNQSNDRLSDADDKALRRIISANLFIGCLFLSMLSDGMYNTPLVNGGVLNTCTVNSTQIAPPHGTWYKWLDVPSGEMGPWYAIIACGHGIAMYDDDNVPIYINPQQGYPYNFHEYSWANLISKVITPVQSWSGFRVQNLLYQGYYFDGILIFPPNLSYAMYVPQYDRTSFWAVLVTTFIVTALVAVAASLVVFSVKKKILSKRAQNQAMVEQKHNEFVNNPTASNYNDYRKAVRKNNLWANLIGGSKYDYVNYWNGDVNQQQGQVEGNCQNPFSATLLGIQKDTESLPTGVVDNNILNDYNQSLAKETIRLIAGELSS